jgi:diadenosine tetraphosphatase ApaH/serine/threonine PP2A family protein phosphatase
MCRGAMEIADAGRCACALLLWPTMVASISYIEGVIATYRTAAEANRKTETRQGNVIELDAEVAGDVMITADLHGHRRNFTLIQRIADLEHHPRRHLIMQEVCHGGPTYASNGGCMSHTMLEDVAKLKTKYAQRFHFLMSNHEWAEVMDYPILKAKKMLNLMFRMGMQEAYGAATEKVREACLEFLRSCPLAVRMPGGVFVCHSAPENVDTMPFDVSIFDRPLEPLDWQEHGHMFRMLWGRDYRQENARLFAKAVNAKVLIHGHDPCPEGFRVPNDFQIILDCCADKAAYVILPANAEFTHDQIVKRIQMLK